MTYLYLDDEITTSLRSYVRRVAPKEGDLTIETVRPSAFAEQIEAAMRGSFDGMILDLRLDKVAGEDGVQADYRAPALAQEIRTRAAEELLDEDGTGDENRGRSEFPIALWSTDMRLRQSYDRDKTSHDLFDLLCVKEHLVSTDPSVPDEEKAPAVAQRLRSLVTGYQTIKALRDETDEGDEQFFRFLGFDAPPDGVDERLYRYVLSEAPPRERPAHEYARFIQREVLESAGPLLDRQTVAARLGVDVAGSDDFGELLGRFDEAAYSGVFHEGWPRWWSDVVEEVAEVLIGASLRPLTAPERVEHLSAATGLDGLVAAEPITADDTTDFWVVCQATNRPLNPRDGFVLETGRRYPWQRDKYVSRYAAENRMLSRRHLRLTVSERERADALFS